GDLQRTPHKPARPAVSILSSPQNQWAASRRIQIEAPDGYYPAADLPKRPQSLGHRPRNATAAA
ncbi:hypothetical protein NHX12_006825, partial [Muraenolepis orangiensis]